jgi:hypothetical protein
MANMDKSLVMFLIIGAGFFYFVINVVKETETDTEKMHSISYQQEQYAKYYKTDSIGQSIVDVTLVDPSTQIKVWNNSFLKKEFLEIFPDFDTMKGFVKNRVRGEELIQKLIKKINEVEDKFFSGMINAEQAKQALEQL